MKQWMKYTAVVCSFFMMVVLFFPYFGSDRVIASEGGTVSGGNITEEDMTESESGEIVTYDTDIESETVPVPYADWSVNYKFELGDVGAEWKKDGVSIETSGNLTASGGSVMLGISGTSPAAAGYEFMGWSCTVTGLDNVADTISGTFYDMEGGQDVDITLEQSKYAGATITFTAKWWDGESITEAGTYTLNAGESYTLGDGTWTVEEDNSNSSYSGGIQFCVSSEGPYTFNSN